jgi:Flp pilus assembly protein TadB
MRTQVRLLAFAGLFGVGVGTVYWFLSSERAGTVFLILMGAATAYVAAYLMLKRREAADGLPEDDAAADQAASSGQPVGRFHTGSGWPVLMAAGLAVASTGLVYGIWLIVAGGILLVAAVVGLMQESRG